MDSINNIQIKTYGCKVNSYDTGLIEDKIKGLEFKDQVFILNTCAVTAEATKEAIRNARKIKREHPKSKIVMTGCSAQVDTELLEKLDYVDLIIANSHKGELGQILKNKFSSSTEGKTSKLFKSNIFKKSDLGVGGGIDSQHTRSFLKVQDGCNSFCTFCVIPFARGKSRSLTIDEITERVNELTAQGIQEVVITGIHIGDYEDKFFGKDNKRYLEDLMEQLLLRTKMPRFRISSLEPVEISDRLLELYQDDRMCPHFHMSLQSLNDKVLKGMKRQNNGIEGIHILNKIHEKIPGVFMGMDLIVGFPGEGESEFQEVYQKLKDSPWSKIHVFPYSERPGTFAVRLDEKNERSISMQRSKIIRELSHERFQTHLGNQLGQIKDVILLKNSKDPKIFKSLSRDYWTVQLESPPDIERGEYQVKITGKTSSELIGEVL